jgi:hypothetical protein
MEFPTWSKATVQVPVPLVMVIVADPVPPPLQAPELVIATPRPELALATTPKVPLYTFVPGACVVTSIVWSIFVAEVLSLTGGATL